MIDPRKARGVRHRLVTVLAVAVCAVLAGARSYAVIAEWAHDLPVSVRLRLGMGRRAPSESTLRRVLQRVDADELDTAVSGWLARHAATATDTSQPDTSQPETSQPNTGRIGVGPGRAIAVDGKTARGARLGDGRAVHLLGALGHRSGPALVHARRRRQRPLRARRRGDADPPMVRVMVRRSATADMRDHVPLPYASW